MSNVNEQTIMGLIMAGGNAKSEAFEAIQAAKNSDFDAATTDLLTAEANGAHADVSLLLVHAQDHLMNAITFRDLAGEVVAIYQRLAANTTVANETL